MLDKCLASCVPWGQCMQDVCGPSQLPGLHCMCKGVYDAAHSRDAVGAWFLNELCQADVLFF